MPNAPPREVELKLRSTEAGLASLKTSELLARHARGSLKKSQLVSTYFDTLDHRLLERGLALRIRRDGDRLIQTLKAPVEASSAAKDRAEWEVELEEGIPDLTAFGDRALLDRVGLVLPEELVRRFETRIQRERVVVDWPDARGVVAVIEVAFDKGTIHAEGKRASLSELELELKEGRPEALFSLALEMRAVAPLAIETRDKAGRGYALVNGTGARATKVPALGLPADCSIEDGMRAIFGHALGHLLDNETAAQEGLDPEGVHQMRVALRRLRSALTIFQDVIDPAARYRWNEEFRWLIGRLGPARDLDVFIDDLLAPIAGGDTLAAPLASLREVALEARARAYGRVRTTLRGDRYADLVLGFAIWVEMAGWRQDLDIDSLVVQRQPLRGFAVRTLAKRHRQVLKRGRHFAHLGPEARHEVRKTLKKLRYGVDYFAPLFKDEDVRAFAKGVARFQDELGHLNDVAVASRLVIDLVEKAERGAASLTGAGIGAGIVMGWYAAASSAHAQGAIESWKSFGKTPPFWQEEEAA